MSYVRELCMYSPNQYVVIHVRLSITTVGVVTEPRVLFDRSIKESRRGVGAPPIRGSKVRFMCTCALSASILPLVYLMFFSSAGYRQRPSFSHKTLKEFCDDPQHQPTRQTRHYAFIPKPATVLLSRIRQQP